MQLLTVILLSCLLSGFVANEVVPAKEVRLQWYMQDTPFNGPTPSSIPVTAYNASDFQNETKNFLYGQIYVIDDPLTQAPTRTSASFGRAQGSYTFVSREEYVGFLSFTVSITTGEYNGSTLNILGAYPSSQQPTKHPIVGGTGQFALARGNLEQTVINLFGPLNASATLLHYVTVYLD